MRKKNVLALLLVLVMAASVALTGCNKPKTPSGDQGSAKLDADQHLNVPLVTEIKTLDSSKTTDVYSATVQLNTQEGLIRVTNDGEKDIIEKAGAESWDVSPDGLTWTFHLRDYKWSDNKPVTAGDYEYAWKRLLDPATKAGYSYLITDKIVGAADFNAGKGSADAVGIKATDDKTLEVKLVKPVAYFDKMLGMQGLLPLRKDIVEAGGETYGQDPSKLVYCGPYTVSEWTKGTRVVLKKNPQYWDASKVKLETVNLPIIQDRNARMKSFDTKELDAAGATGEYKDQYKKLADEKKLQYQYGFTPATSYIFFNTKDKENLFTNRDVRMAFSLAWDKDTFVKNVEKAGAPAYGWVPNRLLIGNDEYRTKVPEELKDIKDDPKQLLTKGLQALGKDTDPSKITVTFLSSGTTQLDKDTFDYLADQWKKNLGIKEVKQDAVTDFAQFQQRVDNEQFQISAMGWIGDYNDPMTFLDMWTSANAAPGGTNSSKYENKDYDALIDQVSKEQDNAKRLDIFKQCEQKLLIDDAVISPMYYQDSNFFSYPYVKDLQLPLFGPIYNLKTAYTQGRQ